MSKKDIIRRILPFIVMLVVLVFLIPREAKFPYDYRVGKEWRYESLYAQFDFPILKTDEQLRSERQNNDSDFFPYFNYSEEETSRVLKAIENLELGSLSNSVLLEVKHIYKIGVIADESRSNRGVIPESELIYILHDKNAVLRPMGEVYRQSTAKSELLSSLLEVTSVNVDSLLKASGVYNYIVPNLFYDAQFTEQVYEEVKKDISPTIGVINTGHLIVSEDEIVNSQIANVLDSYKAEFESNGGFINRPFLLVLGNLLIFAAILALMFFAMRLCSPKVFKDDRCFVVFDLYVFFLLLSVFMERFEGDYVLLVPYTLMLFFFRSFLGHKETLLYYTFSLLPLLICSNDGEAMFLLFLVAGLASLFANIKIKKGLRQVVRALFTFAVLVIFLLAFKSIGYFAGNIWHQLSLLVLNSLLTMLVDPLVALFEKFYNLVSDRRLVELGDTSSEVMRLMEQKAPGSFQHSIQVMNMAETVARAVDVNPELVRVGALYHDIGKVKNPLCFVENESLAGDADHKYHESISPEQSARDIIKHIEDGLEVADEYRLPSLVKDFIITHHGTTCVRYFYDKFVKEGGDPAMRHSFCYKGRRPSSIAQLILMLCDSIEAASRTLRNKSPEAISDFVEGIVGAKMAEGQFDDVNITFADVSTVKEAIKNYLMQLNHQRVAYPKRK